MGESTHRWRPMRQTPRPRPVRPVPSRPSPVPRPVRPAPASRSAAVDVRSPPPCRQARPTARCSPAGRPESHGTATPQARVVDVQRRGQRLQLIDDVAVQAYRGEPVQRRAALRENRDRTARFVSEQRQRPHRLDLQRGADAHDQARVCAQLARALHRLFGQGLAEQHDFRAQRSAAAFAAGNAVRVAEPAC